MMYVRARGLRRRGAQLLLAMTVQPVLSSTRRRVSTLQTNLPFDARFPARTHRYRRFADVLADTHARLAVDRGAATPSLQRTLTSCHLPVSLALSAPKSQRDSRRQAPAVAKRASRPACTATSARTSARKEGAQAGRAIPAALKRQIWQRDGGRCCHVDPRTGRRCVSRYLLEIHHVFPYALGGGAEPSNLRLLCAPHHQHRHAVRASPREREE